MSLYRVIIQHEQYVDAVDGPTLKIDINYCNGEQNSGVYVIQDINEDTNYKSLLQSAHDYRQTLTPDSP